MNSLPSFSDSVKLEVTQVNGRVLKSGARVRLHPQHKVDVFDSVLDGRTATIETIERDHANHIHVAVIVDDEPGKDFGRGLQIANRFFFAPDEIDPL